MTEGKIVVRIKENGEVHAESHGIHGPSCVDEISKILEELALVSAVNKTDEYYMGERIKVKTKQEVKL